MTAVLVEHGHDISGTTANRPTNAEIGQRYFDTTLGCLVVYDGSRWKASSEQAFAAISAAGSAIGNATNLIEGHNRVAGANGTAGVILPAAVAGKRVTVRSVTTGAGVLKIYPQVNSAIDALSANAAYSLNSNAAVATKDFVAYNNTLWESF